VTLPEDIAATAESIVNALKKTVYQYVEHIDPATGLYECDCNGFVGYVVSDVAPQQYGVIPKEADQNRPRAFEYYDFFASLTADSSGGWSRVDTLEDARRGDVVAWRFPVIERHVNTGHVVILAETPRLDPTNSYYIVRVYDSASEAHFDDTREPHGKPSPTGATGVGSGFINLRVDGGGRPIAYQFAPPADAQFSYRPIAIGRVEPQ
jgi:hypothetical protein